MTQFLRFPDEEAWLMAATDAGFMIDGVLVAYTHDRAIDCIGKITRGGEYDPETGDVIVAPTVLDGWHVNLAGVLPDGWEQYAVFPKNPARVWA